MDDLQIDLPASAYGGQGFLTKGEGGHTFADSERQLVDPGTVGLIVFGGSNDINARGDLPGAIRKLCAAARQTARGVKILLVTPPWPTSAVPGASIVQHTNDVRAAARGCPADVMDPVAEKWFPDFDQRRKEIVGADGVHPTDSAHQVFADRMYQWIKQFGRR